MMQHTDTPLGVKPINNDTIRELSGAYEKVKQTLREANLAHDYLLLKHETLRAENAKLNIKLDELEYAAKSADRHTRIVEGRMNYILDGFNKLGIATRNAHGGERDIHDIFNELAVKWKGVF